jgi:hypothetical protein
VTTDINGAYHFDKLVAGSYQVVFGLPTGDVFTTPLAGGSRTVDSNPNPAGVATLTLGPSDTQLTTSVVGDGVTAPQIDRTIDAGIVPLYAIGDYVWNDTNGNGVQDSGEASVAGVKVTLEDSAGHPVTDANGATVNPATTGSDGSYHFDQLVAGTYTVVFSAPPGDNFTTQTAGSDQKVDSNPNPAGVATVVLGPSDANLAASGTGDHVFAPQIDRTIDAGVVVAPSNPSVRVEKYDGDNAFTPNGSVSTADKDTDPPKGDADTAATAISALATATTPVALTFNNNGNVPLYDVTVIDQTVGGTGTVAGLSCTFPDGSKALYFKGPLAVGAVVSCTGTLPALGDGATHEDRVGVYGRPGLITAGQPGENPANPATGSPLTPGAGGSVSDTDLFNVATPVAVIAATVTSTTTVPATTTTTPPSETSSGSGSPLAFTGLNSWGQLLVGLGLLLTGIVSAMAARRRRGGAA